MDVKTTCVQSIDSCMTLQGDVWTHKASLNITWPCFIEVPLLRQEISRLDFKTVPTIQHFMFFFFFILHVLINIMH